MKSRKRFLILLVGGSIAFGLAVILVSLLANQKRWDRETAFAAANYDGEALLATLAGPPVEALDYPEVERGPLAPDLSNADQAWVIWTQAFSAKDGLPAFVAWHRGKLPADEWTLTEENPDKATFTKGEWTLILVHDPQADPPCLHREIRWTRDPSIL
jgi:hypothetical protein